MAIPIGKGERVRLRRARLADFPAIVSLLVDLGYDAAPPGEGEALLAMTLARPDVTLYLAHDALGQPVGLLQLSTRPQMHLGGVLVCIDILVVAAAGRGRGVGRRLLRRARAHARAHRAVRLELHTNRQRESYRRGFYVKNGYREANSALLRLEALETGHGPFLPPPT